MGYLNTEARGGGSSETPLTPSGSTTDVHAMYRAEWAVIPSYAYLASG